jgi:amino acid permease
VSEQATLQLILTAYRFLAFLVMCATILLALWYPNPFDTEARHDTPPYISYATLTNNGMNWSGFGTIFSFAAVALNVHYNLPDVLQPVNKEDKPHLKRVIIGGMVTSMLFYIFIGLVAGLFFGYIQPFIAIACCFTTNMMAIK